MIESRYSEAALEVRCLRRSLIVASSPASELDAGCVQRNEGSYGVKKALR